ncbi:uncharacterized protein LOC141858051 isoform X2 [Brevipalpus obovatus]|uniref:uncharacterized protein LOC141858051 isoform X2 n=1 Tax=Brevipalpus obovatus TaxID=246614 RepID=UPI003D9E771D
MNRLKLFTVSSIIGLVSLTSFVLLYLYSVATYDIEYSITVSMADFTPLATPQMGRISMDIFLESGEKCPIDLNEDAHLFEPGGKYLFQDSLESQTGELEVDRAHVLWTSDNATGGIFIRKIAIILQNDSGGGRKSRQSVFRQHPDSLIPLYIGERLEFDKYGTIKRSRD